MIRQTSLLIWFLMVIGACFDPQYPEGVPCSQAMTCPPGQTCDPVALVCHTGSLAPAPPDTAPALPSDAAPPTVPPDAAAEGTSDAAAVPDAGIGPCENAPCGEHSTCTETPDSPSGYTCICEAGYVGDDQGCRLPRTCLELLMDQPGSPDGLYVIAPELDVLGQPFETFCDMSTDGGGWTLVQRTVWDFVRVSLIVNTQIGAL